MKVAPSEVELETQRKNVLDALERNPDLPISHFVNTCGYNRKFLVSTGIIFGKGKKGWAKRFDVRKEVL
jgi:hypothetical protein